MFPRSRFFLYLLINDQPTSRAQHTLIHLLLCHVGIDRSIRAAVQADIWYIGDSSSVACRGAGAPGLDCANSSRHVDRFGGRAVFTALMAIVAGSVKPNPA